MTRHLRPSIAALAAVIMSAAILLPGNARAIIPKITYDLANGTCTVTISGQTTTYQDLNECRKLERDVEEAENAVLGGVVVIVGLTALVTSYFVGRGEPDVTAFRQAARMILNPHEGFSLNLNVSSDEIRGFGSFSHLNPGLQYKLRF